ncbi:PAS domain-containing hybrid sensor histidine kinase/response regulator [Pseudofulvimonas gallinarii]|uniref:histidine kinase n=1 Tax=Pseudofulvimonas gallinarii TaxID=634155 RepID=A0A4S3KVF9_9GAMM|nr:PAS domain-containing hybrid sensor histidine kinase/response regulator [Pseudofulvimonas gallinarii]TCS97988.1 Na+/proline symporter [Pseudofulvimonas gallinarii]THD13140.1 hybrid sensor histidine kinase/response regulator [Pseudofulvimonas gallinarii]
MISDWVLLLVSVAYVGLLFAVAYVGDRRPLYPTRPRLRPLVYSLALAVYCSSWTFYGAVGNAITSGWNYFAIYLGPILLFVLAPRLIERMILIAKDQSITSIGDFIASRFGKSQPLAVAVALIALTAAVPYVALQFKAVAMSIQVLSGTPAGDTTPSILADTAFWVAVMLALFSILFGTRQIDATEHHHGMMLAVALESMVKLIAFAAVGAYAVWLLFHPPEAATTPLAPLPIERLHWPGGFLAQTLLAFCAMLCLPRQFQVGVIECEDPADLKRARVWFPMYLLVFVALVPPIALAAWPLLQDSGVSADAAVLWLPLSQGQNTLALLAFVGGFSAATGMVIVASVALSIMISNDLVMPWLVRVRKLHLDRDGDLSRVVLWVRRVGIVALAALAFAYYRFTAHSDTLAATGLLAFAAVAQFMPAMLAGLFWNGASRTGVMAGLVCGYAVWFYTLLLPTFARAGWLPDAWLQTGPYGFELLRPEALFGLGGWTPLTHGVFWSLAFNTVILVLLSLRNQPGLSERLRAARFLEPYQRPPHEPGEGEAARLTINDLRELAMRLLGENFVRRAFADYARERNLVLRGEDHADRALLQFTERLLAGAVGAATARHVMTGALSGSGLDLAQVVNLLDTASQELRFSRELLGVTLEHMAQGISVVDRDMRLVAWNRRYVELFDYPDGMVNPGTPIAELIRCNAERGLLGGQGGDSLDEQVERRLSHMRQGSPHLHVREWPDGRMIESRGEPLPGGGYLMTFADITEYVRAERALRTANETLEQRVIERTHELSRALSAEASAKQLAESANLSKTRFLAAASHDLLQPLHAARLFASALRDHPIEDRAVRQLSERVDSSLRAAEELLDGLLDLSRLDTGRLHPDSRDFAAADLLASLRDQFAPLAASRDIELRIHDTRVNVHSDRRLLRRVLQNLIGNALRYTATGRVVVGCRRRRDAVEFLVADTGPGIPIEHQKHIFDEYLRLNTESPWDEHGLGLGLTICQRICHLLDATLTLRSLPGRGSMFMVRVPYAHAQVVQRERPAVIGSPGSLEGMSVLCLDNDRAILDAMRALFDRWQVTMIAAASVDEALRLCQQDKPDALLVDFHLHDRMDGIDALHALQGCWPGAPPRGALVTADSSETLTARARAAGFVVMRKPVKPAVLRAQLGAAWSALQLSRQTPNRRASDRPPPGP